MVLLWPPHLGLILFVKLLMNVIRTTSRTITCAIHRVTVVRVTCHVTCNQRIASNYSTSCCSFQDYSLPDRRSTFDQATRPRTTSLIQYSPLFDENGNWCLQLGLINATRDACISIGFYIFYETKVWPETRSSSNSDPLPFSFSQTKINWKVKFGQWPR
jgi:hypothetical protein